MTNWNKEELLTYVLIWSAYADFVEDELEKEVILSKVSQDTYRKMSREFQQDNDQQRIDKILSAMKSLNYSSTETTDMFEDMKEIFLADGNMGSLEQNLSRGLKRIVDLT